MTKGKIALFLGCGIGIYVLAAPVSSAQGNQAAAAQVDQIQAECLTRINAPEYAALRGRMSVGDWGVTSPAMLSDPTLPSPHERALIGHLASIRAYCIERIRSVINSIGFTLPADVAHEFAQFSSMNALAAELASGRTTYGEHNRRAVQLHADTQATVAKLAAERRDYEARIALAELIVAATTTPSPTVVTRFVTLGGGGHHHHGGHHHGRR